MKTLAAFVSVALLLPVLVIAAVVGGGSGAAPVAAPIIVANDPELARAILTHPNIGLRPGARADVEAGVVDPRILRVLLVLAERHRLSYVGPFKTGHSRNVAGTTRASNHFYGRAVDLPYIDGAPVNVLNTGAWAALREVLALPAEVRPDEVGAPWRIPFGTTSTFTENHDDHLHLGFDQAVVGAR
jgi:hypothetical protein